MGRTSPKQAAATTASAAATNNTTSTTTTTTNLSSHHHHHASPKLHSSVPRSRTNSREFQQQQKTAGVDNNADGISNDSFHRSYSHMFKDDNNVWNDLQKKSNVSFTVFLSTYITLVLAVQFATSLLFSSTAQLQYYYSWSITNLIHLATTLLYIHWFKGNLLDKQGELNAMTVWEQLEAADAVVVKRTLLVVPTVLTYTACVVADFDRRTVVLNISIWCIAILAKLPFMNGVRIFGINRTAGIDDKQQ